MAADKALVAEQHDWLVCHDCGALQSVVPISKDLRLVCSNCDKPLHIGRGPWLDKATALAVSAVLLFVCANAFTFLTLKLAGSERTISIVSGVLDLASREHWILAALVVVTILLLPLFEALALLYLLVPYRLNRHLPGQVVVLKWLVRVQPWIMLDVFLLGVLVTTVKLGDSAAVVLEPGMFFYFALVGVLTGAYWLMDKNNLWSWLYSNNCFAHNKNEALYDCDICKALVGESIVRSEGRCPRCRARIYTRIPNSIQKTAALTLAAAILYIPANLYDIMLYEELAINYDSTIMAGVIDLARSGLWLIALVVFVASIVVPLAKLFMLGYLIWSVQVKMKRFARQRAVLYRLTEFIGRWSMVDVYVVTLLTSVVQFGFLGEVEPGPALLPFAAVVVLTMLAAETFDPRLIWDNADESAAVGRGRRTLTDISSQREISGV